MLSMLSRIKTTLYESWQSTYRTRKPTVLSLLALLTVLILFFIIRYYQTHTSTDNAYVNTDSIQVATQVSGPVITLFISNNQLVHKGEVLFQIDPEPFQLAVEKATAQVLQNKAQLKNAELNLGRVQKLVAKKFLSSEDNDNATTTVDVAAANLKLAEAKLTQAKLDLSYTQVIAAADGYINNLSLRPGTAVQAQVPLFALTSNEYYWVDANFKETELDGIQPQQRATIVLDMYPDHTFHGVVDSISSSSGTAFSLLPPQNATGNWVKVTQRIPVKIRITDPTPDFPLKIGATASVTVHTNTISSEQP